MRPSLGVFGLSFANLSDTRLAYSSARLLSKLRRVFLFVCLLVSFSFKCIDIVTVAWSRTCWDAAAQST